MKIGRATMEEIEDVAWLLGILQDAGEGRWPRPAGRDDAPEDDAPDYFDEDDPEHCCRLVKRVMEVMGVMDGGAITRVVLGMHTVCSPANKIIDQESDFLQVHPGLREAWEKLVRDGKGEG